MALDINALYQQNLGRAPDAAGKAYWQGLLASGMSPAEVTSAFRNAAAQEIQRDDRGLSAATDRMDEQRIVTAMEMAERLGVPFSQMPGQRDTFNQTAAQRFGGFDINQHIRDMAPVAQGNYSPIQAQPMPRPQQPTPQQGLQSTFGNPFAYNQQNPYLDQIGQVVTQQVNENLMRQQLPQIGSQAIAAGGFGGSRQGVLEANALRDANAQIANALTGMRFQDYNQQLGRQLQRYQADQGFYSQQRGQDLQQTQLGASLLGQGTQGLLGQGQGLFGVGQTQQQAPWQVVSGAAGAVSPFTGFGQSTTTSSGNNPWGGMLGGALMGAQFGRLF